MAILIKAPNKQFLSWNLLGGSRAEGGNITAYPEDDK
jgi:hypothetical protein